MCNAHNHSENCTCGWGGNGHLGRRGQGGSGAKYHCAQPLTLIDIDSYTNPNAKCPYCGSSVFFYRSPDGGAVFFDELGPPWPKHPCTIRDALTNTLEPRTYTSTYSDTSLADRDHSPTITYKWFQDGWRPYMNAVISKINGSTFKIVGLFNRTRSIYYFETQNPKLFDEINKPIVHIKQIDETEAKLAFCWPFGSSYAVNAYRNRDDIPTNTSNVPSSRNPISDFSNNIVNIGKKIHNSAIRNAFLTAATNSKNKRDV